MMFANVRRLFIAGLAMFTLLAFLSGCGSPTGSHQYKDGRLYFLNNCRPSSPEFGGWYIDGFWVEYEGVRYDPPFHLTWDGQLTGEGAFELTDYPLPGGTEVTLKYFFDHMNGYVENRPAKAIVDGNITIEAYMQLWVGYHASTVLHKVHPGKWEGSTIILQGTEDPSDY